MSELPFNEVNGVWKQLAAGYASTQGESFTGHGGSPVAVEEAEHFFVHFDQKGRKRKLTAVCSHQTRIGNLDAHL
ncbi:hypothetical protein, partial [Escherichia coli]